MARRRRRTRRTSLVGSVQKNADAGAIDTEHMKMRMTTRRQSVTDHHKLLNQQAAATMRGHRASMLGTEAGKGSAMAAAAAAAREDLGISMV